MWDTTGDVGDASMADGTGFFTGTPSGGSIPTPTSEKKAGAQRAHNVMPVNIGDVLEAPEGTLTIEGTEAHMVTFIGTLEKIELKPTNFVYTICDDSGVIEVIQWVIEGNSTPDVGVVENTFVRVIGAIRHSQDRRHVMAFKVAPITSANEITTHLLETIYAPLKLRQINKKTNPANGATASNESMAGPSAVTSNISSDVHQPQPKNQEPNIAQPAAVKAETNEKTSNQPAINGLTAATGSISGSMASASNYDNENGHPREMQPAAEAERFTARPEVRMQWEPIFNYVFHNFNTVFEKWTFSVDNFPKGHFQNRRDSMILERNIFTKFCCSTCNKTWCSNYPLVLFHILRRPIGGHISIDIRNVYQRCRTCEAQYEDYFEGGYFENEEIEKIFFKILTKIEIMFYGKEADERRSYYTERDHLGGPHEREHCKDCIKYGDCRRA